MELACVQPNSNVLCRLLFLENFHMRADTDNRNLCAAWFTLWTQVPETWLRDLNSPNHGKVMRHLSITLWEELCGFMQENAGANWPTGNTRPIALVNLRKMYAWCFAFPKMSHAVRALSGTEKKIPDVAILQEHQEITNYSQEVWYSIARNKFEFLKEKDTS